MEIKTDSFVIYWAERCCPFSDIFVLTNERECNIYCKSTCKLVNTGLRLEDLSQNL